MNNDPAKTEKQRIKTLRQYGALCPVWRPKKLHLVNSTAELRAESWVSWVRDIISGERQDDNKWDEYCSCFLVVPSCVPSFGANISQR